MGCSNCLKRGLDCSGAITHTDSIIRDETAKTASKFSVVGSSAPPSGSQQLVFASESGPSNISQPRLSQSPSTSYDFDELALDMFYSTYCLRDVPRKSPQDFAQIGNGALYMAVKTLGLESIPNRNEFQVMRLYNEAIGLLNTALATPDLATSDSTLLSTIIMCTIEMKACPQLSLDDYFNHVQGASALLQLRGPEQVSTKLGAALYMQMSAQVYLGCLFGQQRLPDGFRQLREQVATYTKEPPLPCWREHGAMMRFIDFKHAAERSIKQGQLSLENATPIVVEAFVVYEELSSIFENAPPIWRFQSINSAAQPWVEQEHIYKSFIAAVSWTSFRLTTAMLFDVVLRTLQACSDPDSLISQLTDDRKLYIRNAVDILREAALAIISSAPQQVDFMSMRLVRPGEDVQKRIQLAPESFEKTQIFHCDPFVRGRIVENGDLPFVVFPSGVNVYHALYLAATIPSINLDVKQRLGATLGSIAAETGIKQAKHLSKILTESMRPAQP